VLVKSGDSLARGVRWPGGELERVLSSAQAAVI
jgi:hypothetical protein